MTFPALSLDFFLPLQVSPLAMERGVEGLKEQLCLDLSRSKGVLLCFVVLFLISALSAPDLTCPVIWLSCISLVWPLALGSS